MDIRPEDGTRKWLRTSYTERNGIYIIDLQKSVGMVDTAYKAVFDIAAEGGSSCSLVPRNRLRTL